MNNDTVATVLTATNWKLLAEQKLALIEQLDACPALQGLVNWMDALQDAAEKDGYPVVFLTEEENE